MAFDTPGNHHLRGMKLATLLRRLPDDMRAFDLEADR